MEKWNHHPFIAVFVAWTVAQGIKFIANLIKNKRIDFRYFVSTGGMPSAHSASVSALATSVGIVEGFSSSVFAVALTFAMVVMFDAQSVRFAMGQQARILNQMMEEILVEHHWPQGRLKELLGHTRVEVLMGMGTGVIVALLLSRV